MGVVINAGNHSELIVDSLHVTLDQLQHGLIAAAVRPTLRHLAAHPRAGAVGGRRHAPPRALLGARIEAVAGGQFARLLSAGYGIEVLGAQLDLDVLVDAHEHVLAATGRLHVDLGEVLARLVHEHVPAGGQIIVVVGRVVHQVNGVAVRLPGSAGGCARYQRVTTAVIEIESTFDVDIYNERNGSVLYSLF